MLNLALSFVPLAGASAVTFTVWRCYWLTKSQGKFPPGVTIPAISALGVSGPERPLYQLGFASTGLLLLASLFLWQSMIVPHVLAGRAGDDLAKASAVATAAMKAGGWMAAGVIAQGVFTLEMKISLQSLVHWAGAVVFIWGAMRHCEAATKLYTTSIDEFPSPLFQLPIMRLSLMLKKACLAAPTMMFIVPLLFQLYSSAGLGAAPDQLSPPPLLTPAEMLELETMTAEKIRSQLEQVTKTVVAASATKKEMTTELAGLLAKQQLQGGGMENGMGAMQWAMVFAFVLYFATYTVDFLCAAYMGTPDDIKKVA